METEPVLSEQKEELKQNLIRQIIILPDYGTGDRLIIMGRGNDDMLSMTEEQVRLGEKANLPAIGIVYTDGRLSLDPQSCVDNGYYENTFDVIADVKTALVANGFNEVKIFDWSNQTYQSFTLNPKK